MKLYIYIFAHSHTHFYALRCCCFMFNHQPGRYKYKFWQWYPPYGHPMRAQLAACSSTAVRCDMLRFFCSEFKLTMYPPQCLDNFFYHVFFTRKSPEVAAYMISGWSLRSLVKIHEVKNLHRRAAGFPEANLVREGWERVDSSPLDEAWHMQTISDIRTITYFDVQLYML